MKSDELYAGSTFVTCFEILCIHLQVKKSIMVRAWLINDKKHILPSLIESIAVIKLGPKTQFPTLKFKTKEKKNLQLETGCLLLSISCSRVLSLYLCLPWYLLVLLASPPAAWSLWWCRKDTGSLKHAIQNLYILHCCNETYHRWILVHTLLSSGALWLQQTRSLEAKLI